MAEFPDWAWLLLLVVSNIGAYRRGRRAARIDGTAERIA